jgi:hypothetical protein
MRGEIASDNHQTSEKGKKVGSLSERGEAYAFLRFPTFLPSFPVLVSLPVFVIVIISILIRAFFPETAQQFPRFCRD